MGRDAVGAAQTGATASPAWGARPHVPCAEGAAPKEFSSKAAWGSFCAGMDERSIHRCGKGDRQFWKWHNGTGAGGCRV